METDRCAVSLYHFRSDLEVAEIALLVRSNQTKLSEIVTFILS